MPRRKHLRGVGAKEQRQYKEIVKSSRGRYGKNTKEVAARIVMKRHKLRGQSKGKKGKKL